MSKNRLISISDQQSPGHKDLSSFTDSKMVVAEGHILTFHLADLHRTLAEGVKRYVLLSSPLPSTLGLSALDSSKGGGGPDRTRTCDPALIKRML